MNKLWIFAVALAAIGAASAAAWGGPHHHRPPPHHHWPDHDSSEDSDSEWDSESMSRPWSNSDSSERSDSSSCEDFHHHHHHHPWGYPDHGPSQPWHGPPPPPHGPHGHGPPPPPPHGPHGHGPPPPHHHGPPPPPPHHHHGPPPPPPPPPHHHHGPPPPPPPPGPYPPPNQNQPRPPGPFREPNPPQPGLNQFPRPNQPRPNQPGPNQPRPSQPTPNQPGPFPPQPNPSQPQPNQASRQACINGCPVTSEFNPVCGTDGVTYNNAGRLECARLCGVDVQLSRNSRCDIDGESTSARPTSPPPRPDVQACISRCPVTPEYNPVCGSDGVTYSNPGRLECSKQCGVNVQLTRNSRCPVNQPATSSPITNPTGIPSATPWPLPSSSTGVSISKDLLEEIFTTEADTTGLIDVRNNVE